MFHITLQLDLLKYCLFSEKLPYFMQFLLEMESFEGSLLKKDFHAKALVIYSFPSKQNKKRGIFLNFYSNFLKYVFELSFYDPLPLTSIVTHHFVMTYPPPPIIKSFSDTPPLLRSYKTSLTLTSTSNKMLPFGADVFLQLSYL